MLDEAFHSFVGEYAMPTRYGLTVGEYARFVRAHLQLDLDLFVCPMEGYARNMLYSDTGLVFVPPSPNIPTLESALSYIGTCVFEGTNLSEGRGTATPFQWIGAPWLDTKELAAAMRALQLPGVLFRRAAHLLQIRRAKCERVDGARHRCARLPAFRDRAVPSRPSASPGGIRLAPSGGGRRMAHRSFAGHGRFSPRDERARVDRRACAAGKGVWRAGAGMVFIRISGWVAAVHNCQSQIKFRIITQNALRNVRLSRYNSSGS